MGVRDVFSVRTCSRRIGKAMARHEEGWLRVLQLGSRVTVIVDRGPVGEPMECEVCGKPVKRLLDTCATEHNRLNEPYCREHHPSPVVRNLAD